jgi:hypothetical protein
VFATAKHRSPRFVTDPAPKPETESLAPLDQEADAAIAACDGDVRAALKAALVANSFLIAEVEELSRAVSVGYTRGKTPARRASEKVDDWREISSGEGPVRL